MSTHKFLDPTGLGQVWGKIKALLNISSLSDTDIASPSDGQILTYNSTTSKWENEDAADNTFIVTITSSTTADKTYSQVKEAYDAGMRCIAVYGNANGSVVLELHRITTSLVEFTTTAAGRNYYKLTINKGGTVSYGSNSFLTDITSSGSVTDGSILQYSSTTSKWEYVSLPDSHAPEEDIEIIKLLSEYGFPSPITDNDGDIIVDVDDNIIVV